MAVFDVVQGFSSGPQQGLVISAHKNGCLHKYFSQANQRALLSSRNIISATPSHCLDVLSKVLFRALIWFQKVFPGP